MSIDKMPKLGFGLMRLPADDGEIDMPQVCAMVDACMEHGFNYFDTAYVYHGGKSEGTAKEALVTRYPRESFYLATKLPGWELKSADDCDRLFNIQLERAGVEYFDFYLLHSIEGGSYEGYLKHNCFEWAKQKKAGGKIRHFGFSFHGTPELLEEILENHPEIEFVQIQLNYADWNNPLVQSGRLYEILRRRDMPIIVMEPVKGGMLAGMKPEITKLMTDARPDNSPASWAIRFAASLEGVRTVLSGMSDIAQLRDNIATLAHIEPISESERGILNQVVQAMAAMPTIPCTDCRYCCDNCPASIRIPDIFRALNTLRMYGEHNSPRFFYGRLGGGRAKDCIKCGRCENICPQHLAIIELMGEASGRLDK